MDTVVWSNRFRYLVFVVLGLIVGAFIWYIRALIIPLVISGLLAFMLSPTVSFLTNRTILSKRFAAIIVFAISLLVILAIPAALTPTLVYQAGLLGDDLSNITFRVQEFLSQPLVFLNWSINLGGLFPDFSMLSPEALTPYAESALQFLESVTRNLAWFLVILFATYYLLQEGDKVRDWVVGLAPEEYQPDLNRLVDEISRIWRSYFGEQLAWMLVVGVVITIALLGIGMPGALVLGIITGLFSLLPDIGPVIAALLTVLVALLEGSSYLPLSNFWFGVLVGLTYLVLINLMNITLRPRILGRSVKIHEGVVFIAVIAAVILQGVFGALIILPVLSSAAVVGRYLRSRILGLPPFPETVEENVGSGK